MDEPIDETVWKVTAWTIDGRDSVHGFVAAESAAQARQRYEELYPRYPVMMAEKCSVRHWSELIDAGLREPKRDPVLIEVRIIQPETHNGIELEDEELSTYMLRSKEDADLLAMLLTGQLTRIKQSLPSQ